MRTFVSKSLESWPLLGTLAVILIAATAAAYGLAAGDSDGLRSIIRLTARTSLALFLMAFAAAALAWLVPSGPTRWLRRNRRQLGLSFALSHGIHLVAIILLARHDPLLFWQLTNIGNVVSGGLAYLFIAAMAATSFDRSAAWLGPRAWRLLHWTGGHYVWISFVVANGKRVPMSAWYLLPVGLLALVLVLRLVARFRVSSRRATI
ncbi:ferric reductase-like transmembrane domain-containing protein [Phreatobacter stygius]|uniref:Ferric oxidoreductase domain-containing protein n=1 Tax=Phreatobacter stygius TaxID=1940610 RepID=A0A4D7AZM0_9HYPH|nr:ferric reductase-like transmembrane domain-containing protein [Phreatobacter stygius]QCI65801.1 hypothetical protein E8M01_17230 [Phreatobacter stygius]